MYILVPDGIPSGFAINSAAHAGCCAGLRWYNDPDFRKWATTSFRKVTCRADDDALHMCKYKLGALLLGETLPDWKAAYEAVADHIIEVTESDLDGRLVAVVFKPRANWPACFKALDLWG
jgi:hypothetical protein